MKRIILLVTVFVMCFLVFTLIKTPAAIALDLAAPHLPKQLQLGKASGSLWDGRIMQVRFDGEQLNNVRWKLSGWSLLTGKLVGTVRFGDPRDKTDISGHADFSYGLFNQAVLVKNTTLRLSVERAMARLKLPLPISAQGRVIVDLDEFSSGQPYCETLMGEIASPNIDVQGLNGWFSVGPLSGRLSCKSGDIAVLVDPENRLGLEADAVLKANLDFKVAGYIKPEASLPKEVHDAAKFLGRPDSEGRYPLNL
ncbi:MULTISPECIES: type II secretion system protein N [Pseudoalteromonas]|jgi:general secretion pathway protein N|uniref:Type II secretion system protein N n=1 Tax=Pseudoalteromonas lipolytica TaxID=570156 RepID=A0ABY1GS04_9GAMM|nr:MULTISPECIES: type II secretion system protein N [Pseudoalteromonas]MBE0352235.1 general secretion pathway protein N [Pseudoalteromonas lipolytica LMEB 39]QLJ08573.1 type II secretion system protein N [Pseudoalteromonas sp. JSTW]QMW14822.1 type II secretion system protein N [Pseudoalteromonas sp. MT33b]SFU01983.1 general secretion pathway protein N [Pseudoalteromonas lipolytica]